MKKKNSAKNFKKTSNRNLISFRSVTALALLSILFSLIIPINSLEKKNMPDLNRLNLNRPLDQSRALSESKSKNKSNKNVSFSPSKQEVNKAYNLNQKAIVKSPPAKNISAYQPASNTTRNYQSNTTTKGSGYVYKPPQKRVPRSD